MPRHTKRMSSVIGFQIEALHIERERLTAERERSSDTTADAFNAYFLKLLTIDKQLREIWADHDKR